MVYSKSAKNLSESEVDKLVDVVAERGSAFEIVDFVRYREDLSERNISKLVVPLISKGDGTAIFNFLHCATNIGVKDVDKLTDVIIKFGIAIFIYNFALDEKLSAENLDKLTEAIIKTKEFYFICAFARDIRRLSVENLRSLKDYVIGLGDAYCIGVFRDVTAQRLPEKDMLELDNEIIRLSKLNNQDVFNSSEKLVKVRKNNIGI